MTKVRECSRREGFDSAEVAEAPRVQARLRGALGSSARVSSHTMTSWQHRQAVNLNTTEASDFKGDEALVFSQVQAQGSPSDVMPGKGSKETFGVTHPGQGEGAQTL